MKGNGHIHKLNKEQIKWLAMVFMTLDHVAEILLTPALNGSSDILAKLQISVHPVEVLRNVFICFGSFTGTAMLYFLIEGYFYTKDIKKYILRLFMFGIISQVPFYIASQVPLLNMLFTLAICLCAIYVNYELPDTWKKYLIIFGLFLLNCFTDWNVKAIPITLFLCKAFIPCPETHSFNIHPLKLKIAWVKSLILLLAIKTSSDIKLIKIAECCGFILAAIILTWFYDSTKYKVSGKYVFYIFYPAHLAVIWIISKLIL